LFIQEHKAKRPALFSELNSGLDCGTGLTESCTHPISMQHTHYYTTVHLHRTNWIQGRLPSFNINIIKTRWSFSSHFCWCACYPNMHGNWSGDENLSIQSAE